MSNAFVIAMGMGVVFIGLIGLVVMVSLTGKIVQSIEKKAVKSPPSANETESFDQQEEIADRGELVAAIAAVLAEELGTSVKGLRILSLKRL